MCIQHANLVRLVVNAFYAYVYVVSNVKMYYPPVKPAQMTIKI